MAKRKTQPLKPARAKEDKGLQAQYAKLRREFTAAELQKYTQIEKGIPLKHVIAEMEQIHRKLIRKRA